ncbi:MAG: hypothetical protein U0Q16_20875 [Bryobacteraceae bacterium]
MITFGPNLVDPLTVYTESGFSVQTVVGNSWRITSTTGNPVASLSTGNIAPTVGNRVDIFLTGGGLFAFNKFQFRAAAGDDAVDLIGEVNSVVTQQLLGVGNGSTSFQTGLSGFPAPVDRLRIVVASVGRTALFWTIST